MGRWGVMVVGEATVSATPTPIPPFSIPWLLLRDVKPRGDPGTGAGVPDASTRALPRGALQHHDSLLEEPPRGAAHLRIYPECAG